MKNKPTIRGQEIPLQYASAMSFIALDDGSPWYRTDVPNDSILNLTPRFAPSCTQRVCARSSSSVGNAGAISLCAVLREQRTTRLDDREIVRLLLFWDGAGVLGCAGCVRLGAGGLFHRHATVHGFCSAAGIPSRDCSSTGRRPGLIWLRIGSSLFVLKRLPSLSPASSPPTPGSLHDRATAAYAPSVRGIIASHAGIFGIGWIGVIFFGLSGYLITGSMPGGIELAARD